MATGSRPINGNVVLSVARLGFSIALPVGLLADPLVPSTSDTNHQRTQWLSIEWHEPIEAVNTGWVPQYACKLRGVE